MIYNLENYLADSVQLKKQATYIFNGEVHTEEDIDRKIIEICQIKSIDDPDFRSKLKEIFMRSNSLTKYKKDLSSLYEEKINKNNKEHMKMLVDIWRHFNPKDPKINEIDEKWRKFEFYLNKITFINIKIFYLVLIVIFYN